MAGNLDYKENSDLYDMDIFLYDEVKLIHIATAGMPLINSLASLDFNPLANLKRVLLYRRVFEYELNNEIVRDNLVGELSDYIHFFNLMAKRGFFSFDKVNISNTEDYRFQLISKPKYECKILLPKYNVQLGNADALITREYDINFIKATKNFPDTFEIFDITEYV